jgi:hypothetical protein
MSSLASPFGMVKCALQLVHLGWYNVISDQFIWDGTMSSLASAFGMVKCALSTACGALGGEFKGQC